MTVGQREAESERTGALDGPGLVAAARTDRGPRDRNEDAFVCRPDLEAELIRAAGPENVVGVIEALGEQHSFHSFQRQPFQRGRPLEAQLHRFLGTHSGRKALYARALVDAVAEESLPTPLEQLLLAI